MEYPVLQDDHDYIDYSLAPDPGPPTARIISAVVNNQLDLLRKLLDSPKWYYVTDRSGYNLLQIAILTQREEAFDFLLALPNYPLDLVNKYGQTALTLSLDCYIGSSVPSEFFAYQLLQNGANFDIVCDQNDSPLHRAFDRCYLKVAKFLIEAGVDINSPNHKGTTPLELAMDLYEDSFEFVSALLVNGAEVTVDFFEKSVMACCDLELQEILLLYVSDFLPDSEISLEIILYLAHFESPLFDEIMKYSVKVDVSDVDYCSYLFSMKLTYLEKILEKFSSLIGAIFKSDAFRIHGCSSDITKENMDLMLQSDFKFDLINVISQIESTQFFDDVTGLYLAEDEVTESYCYFLSYGLRIKDVDLEVVYDRFGYCELFKILLHMDIEIGHEMKLPRDLMPLFRYDVGINFKMFLRDSFRYSLASIDEFSRYFAHRKVIDRYNELLEKGYAEERSLPQLPSLIELARNEFRDYFIKKFKIRSSRQFYTLLNSFPISNTYKKIITYDRRLYW